AALIGEPEARAPLAVEAGAPGPAPQPADGAAAASAAAAIAPEPAEVQPAPPRTPRVLLVEDNPVNLMVGQRLLAMLGITCDTAGNGEAALMRMSASRYDLVLMDCQMPVMDGYTATRQWRESEAAAGGTRHLPIIAMTANAMAGDRQKCLDAGMDDYLPKPVTRSELERCIYHWWNPDQPQRDEAALVEDGEFELEAATAGHADTPPGPDHAAVTADTPVAATRPVSEAAPEAVAPAPRAPAIAEPPPRDPAPAPAADVPIPPVRQAPPVIDEEVLGELRTILGEEVEHLI